MPRFTPSPAALDDLAKVLVRGVLFSVFFVYGGQKLFAWFGGYGIEGTADWMASQGLPLPTLSALAAGSAEFFGAFALLLGVAFRPAAAVLAFTMLVALTTQTRFVGGADFPLSLAAVLTALALTGPGRLTLSEVVRARLPRRQPQLQGV